MVNILKKPKIRCGREELIEAFQTIAGKSASPGHISLTHLSRALYRGDGGYDPLTVEEILSMLEHSPAGVVNYMEMIDLMMGSSDPNGEKKKKGILKQAKKL
jgi:Ca2+-binding EF-hand superfamily protein